MLVFKNVFCSFSQISTHTEYVKIKQKRWRVLQKSCLHSCQVDTWKATKSQQQDTRKSTTNNKIATKKHENETCVWTPNNVFLSMIVVESLSCTLERPRGTSAINWANICLDITLKINWGKRCQPCDCASILVKPICLGFSRRLIFKDRKKAHVHAACSNFCRDSSACEHIKKG